MSETEVIKERISVVDIVSEYIELKKAGVNFMARCPFHNEKTPSFYVSPERNTYKCFGCGEGGDIFSFVMYMDGLSFPEALKKLADRAGVTLTERKSDPKKKEQKESLAGIMDSATAFYQKKLESSSFAKSYLQKRGISDVLKEKWKVGFAPEGWRNLHDHLVALGYSIKDIEAAGLIKKGEKGNYYDRFRERIIFPLESLQGQVIAFSGRYTGSDDVPAKYLNSPETPLFNKSRELYGISHAKKTMRQYDFVCVVEGQIDMVMGSSVFANTVATSGTALTKEHLQLIKRFTDRVVFVFDGDRAGVSAAFKASMIALSLDMEVKIASLPDGSDPADVITEDPEAYKEIIASAELSFDFFTAYIAKNYLGREQTTMIEERLFPLLKAVNNPLERDRYVDHMSLKLGRSKESIMARLSQISEGSQIKRVDQEEATVQPEKSEKLLSKLIILRQWLSEQGKDNLIVISENKEFEELIQQHTTQVTLNEEMRFTLENTLQTDILIQNEIQELTSRAESRFTEYKLDTLKSELQKAEQSGNESEKKSILQQIQTLLL